MLLCVTGRIGANPVDGLVVTAVGSRSSLAGGWSLDSAFFELQL